MRTKDGYIIIGEQAYGTQEAPEKAREDLEYFEKTGKHLPPLYPTRSDLRPEQYIDVTNKAIYLIGNIASEAKKHNFLENFGAFKTNFDNDKIWDLQVNYDLPRQQLVRDKNRHPQLDPNKSGRFLTQDQYAVFNPNKTRKHSKDESYSDKNNIRRAGYISNYAYGYAAAAAGFTLSMTLGAAQIVSLKGNLKFDNKDDQRAIEDGWNDYKSGIRF